MSDPGYSSEAKTMWNVIKDLERRIEEVEREVILEWDTEKEIQEELDELKEIAGNDPERLQEILLLVDRFSEYSDYLHINEKLEYLYNRFKELEEFLEDNTIKGQVEDLRERIEDLEEDIS